MYGERIQTLRRLHHMSRAALGEVVGVSATAVYKWENNLSVPDINTMMQLADLFGVTIDDLCDRIPAPADGAPCAEVMVARAIRRMSPDEQEKFLNVGRVLFAHAFAEELSPEDPYGPEED